MRIVTCTDNVDLRTVVSKSGYLRNVADRYHLRGNEAACFTNKAQTRFRLVFKVKNSVFLCIPEIDDSNRLSVFLRISEELAHLAGLKDTRIKLSLIKQGAETRIKNQDLREAARAAHTKQPARTKK